VDWIGALLAVGIPTGRLATEMPFLGTLVKKEEDVEAVAKAGAGARARWPRDDG
jgi:hypothetical protein